MVAAVPERVDAADVLLVHNDALDRDRGFLPVRAGARVGHVGGASPGAGARRCGPMSTPGCCAATCPRASGRSPSASSTPSCWPRPASSDWRARDASIVPPHATAIRLDPVVFVPAPAQGAIAVQVRRDAAAVRAAVAAIDDSARRARCAPSGRRSRSPRADARCRSARGARRSPATAAAATRCSGARTARWAVRWSAAKSPRHWRARRGSELTSGVRTT